MSSTSSISGSGASQWQLLKQLRAGQAATSDTATAAVPTAAATSTSAATPVVATVAGSAPGISSTLDGAAAKLVADLQSFLLDMQSSAATSTTGGSATSPGATSTAATGTATASAGTGSVGGVASGLQSVFGHTQNLSGFIPASPQPSGSAAHLHQAAGSGQDPAVPNDATGSAGSTGGLTDDAAATAQGRQRIRTCAAAHVVDCGLCQAGGKSRGHILGARSQRLIRTRRLRRPASMARASVRLEGPMRCRVPPCRCPFSVERRMVKVTML